MDDIPATQNPYAPEHPYPPFAGRGEAFVLLQNHLNNPTATGAALFIGRRRIGKTALLRHVPLVFDDNHLIAAIDTAQHIPTDRDSFYAGVAMALIEAVRLRDFMLMESLLALPEDDVYDWLLETLLPALTHAIRPQRRFILLIDDVHVWLDAVQSDTESTIFSELYALLGAQMGMALALCDSHEEMLPQLQPLTLNTTPHRLGVLARADVESLLNDPVRGIYRLDESQLDSIYAATGGDPGLLRQYGQHLYDHHDAGKVLDADALKRITTAIYDAHEAVFRELWGALNADEQIFLTALASRYYANPLATTTTADIERWLVETDYPLDSVAINAAFRGLEYREIIIGGTSDVRFVAELLRRWVIEHVRPDRRALDARVSAPTEADETPRWVWMALAGGLIVVVVIVLLISLNSGANGSDAVPTVTLLPSG